MTTNNGKCNGKTVSRSREVPDSGQATPAPPVGTSLGKYGINLGQFFVQAFNDRTKEAAGMMIPVVVSVYNDRSFDFYTKAAAAVLLKKAVGLAKGSGVPNKTKVGTVTRAQLAEIATLKMNDLNARDVDHAVRIEEPLAAWASSSKASAGRRRERRMFDPNAPYYQSLTVITAHFHACD